MSTKLIFFTVINILKLFYVFIDITNGKLLFISIILSCLATEWREWTQEYHQYASGPWNVPHNMIYPQKP